MSRWIGVLVMVALVAGARPPGVRAQTPQAPRRVSFAEVATTVAQSNLQVRAASFDVAVAQAQLAQARGARQPSVTVSGSYTQMQSIPGQTVTIPNPFGPAPPTITFAFPASDTNQVAVRVGLQFPLYTGGRIESQIALAEANLRGAQAVFARTIQQVVFQAQQAYLSALLARENLAAAQRTLDQANESLQVARARVAAGVAAEFDALQADVSVAGAQQGLVRAQVGVRNSDASLNALLNQPLGTPLAFSDTLEPRAVAGTMEGSIEQALRTRPELVEVRARAEAARASIELAASGGRPNLSLSSGYEFSGPTGSIVGAWSATLAVTLSLYDGGITRERIREAELRVEQLKVVEAQTRQRIELDVRQAWLALEQANGRTGRHRQGRRSGPRSDQDRRRPLPGRRRDVARNDVRAGLTGAGRVQPRVGPLQSSPRARPGHPRRRRSTVTGSGHNGYLIDLRNVVKSYESAAGVFVALKGVDLQVDAGEFVAIIGKSGSGKSTLINMITGIDRPTSGEVFVGGTPVHTLSEGQMAVWRGRTLGIIFQFFQLLPTLTVLENVMLPMDFCKTVRAARAP